VAEQLRSVLKKGDEMDDIAPSFILRAKMDQLSLALYQNSFGCQ
jgi:hypothetical protein